MKIKLFPILAIIILLLNLLVIITPPVSATFTWWNGNYNYMKNCYISNKYMNYQIMLKVGNTAGSNINVTCDGHCQKDFGDVRFVHDNTSAIPYWIQNYTSGVQAWIWVNNSYNDSCIQMYYGGLTTLQTTSNGNTTFDLFDDFNGSSLNTHKWTVTGAVTTSFSNSIMSMSTTAIGQHITSSSELRSASFGAGYQVIAKKQDIAGKYMEGIGFSLYNLVGAIGGSINDNGLGVFDTQWRDSGSMYETSNHNTILVPFIVSICRTSTLHLHAYLNYTITMAPDQTTEVPNTILPIVIGHEYRVTAIKQDYYDWVAVAKWRLHSQSCSPIWKSFGSENFGLPVPETSVDTIAPLLQYSVSYTIHVTVSIGWARHVWLYYAWSCNGNSFGNYVNYSDNTTSAHDYSFTFTNGSGVYRFYSRGQNTLLQTEVYTSYDAYVIDIINSTLFLRENIGTGITGSHQSRYNTSTNIKMVWANYSKPADIFSYIYNLNNCSVTAYVQATDYVSKNVWINGSGITTPLHITNSTDHAIPLHYINFNSTGWWFTDADWTHASYTNYNVNVTGTSYFVWHPLTGWELINSYTGVTTPIHLLEYIINAIGTHTYILNSTGYWINASYNGTTTPIHFINNTFNVTRNLYLIHNGSGYWIHNNDTGNLTPITLISVLDNCTMFYTYFQNWAGYTVYAYPHGILTPIHIYKHHVNDTWSNLIRQNSTGYWYYDNDTGNLTSLTFYDNHTNTTWSHVVIQNTYGYFVYDTDNGILTPIHFINHTINVTGNYTYHQNGTGYWVTLNFVGNGSINITIGNYTILLDPIQFSILFLGAITGLLVFLGYLVNDKRGFILLLFGGFLSLSLCVAILSMFTGLWFLLSPIIFGLSIKILYDGAIQLYRSKK